MVLNLKKTTTKGYTVKSLPPTSGPQFPNREAIYLNSFTYKNVLFCQKSSSITVMQAAFVFTLELKLLTKK